MSEMCGCAGKQVLETREAMTYTPPKETTENVARALGDLWKTVDAAGELRHNSTGTAYVPATEHVWLEVPEVPTLKDSGQRETFPSGMVRDTRRGKGRYDLISPYALRALAMILEAGCAKYGERNWELGRDPMRFFDSCLRHLMQWRMGMTDERHLRQAFWNLHCIVHFDEKERGE